jgi:dTDP-4-amino-4,6-dideoxygalactose transaminase
MSRIYLSPPDVGAEERAMLLDAFDSNWIAPLGPHVDAFEAEIAAFVGAGHAVALSSGTAALHLMLLLHGIGPGDEVIVPSFTFISTAATVQYVGARPVFVDCSPTTWNIDPELVTDELARRAKTGTVPSALVAVDLYGQCADFEPLIATCERHGVTLLEDAAEALGASYGDRSAGTFGTAGAFSFNGNKIITTSGGGMLITDSEDMAERARHLATQAREPFPYYQHESIGFNYRMSNLLAAVGRAQLRGLPERIDRRRHVNGRYRTALANVPGIVFMPQANYGVPNYWLTCILVDAAQFGADRETLRLALEAIDVESRPVWKPLHLQPVFADMPVVGGEACSGIFDRGLCLPSGSNLANDDIDRIVETITATAR